ncbi:hypothetical protein CYMTET_8302 [Cymbomonas tetramitiformis]|uniref:Uncharacterized protein n=1 Tax=Cymbomonas tetramitiformis TaxID=36881 RepID=A0AAE0GTV6_9CHLO|nr:hypothetical protein CYMTET_8302 [Cymbomonas tetramitiformis]
MKYPGSEQVDALAVQIKIPGTWFNSIPAEDKNRLFTATAIEYEPVRACGSGRNIARTEAIRFQVTEDVEEREDHNHEGYWMRLDQWNRFRHDTYKNCREDELQYITNGVSTVIAPATSEGVLEGVPTKTTFVYKFFNFVTTEEHVVRLGQHAGKTRNCSLYTCNLCLKAPMLKVFGGSTGGLFKHLKSFHPAEHTEAT